MVAKIPPSTYKICPFTKSLALDDKKIAAPAKSFGSPHFAAGVLLIQCSMPSAVLNYLVASIYSPKKIVDSVASTIVVSTVMSFATIPVVVFFALKYFN